MKTGVPAMRTGVPCNENKFFPVWKTSQGKPCSGPVLALYRIAVCNQFYNYSVVLGAAIKCKPYSVITVESQTQLKTVKDTSNIFAV